MSINTLDTYIGGTRHVFTFQKSASTTGGAGRFGSYWEIAGYPGVGAVPAAFDSGTGYNPDSSTAGALPWINPVSGETKVTQFTIGAAGQQDTILFDRLQAIGNFSPVNTGTQSVTTPVVCAVREITYIGTELWWFIRSAATGSSADTWTVSYENESGATHSATYAKPANTLVQYQGGPFILAAGDLGISKIKSFACSSGSGASSATITLAIVRMYNMVSILSGVVGREDINPMGGLWTIPNSPCLFLVGFTAAAAINRGSIVLVQG
jgi:hypothetical protein